MIALEKPPKASPKHAIQTSSGITSNYILDFFRVPESRMLAHGGLAGIVLAVNMIADMTPTDLRDS